MSSSTETLDTIETVNILGVNVAAVNMPRLVQVVTDAADSNTKVGYYCATNVYTTVLAYENDAYRSILNNSALTYPDGGPIASLGRKRGFPDMRRTAGPDLLNEILSISADHGWRHLFYGSTAETLSKMRKNIETNWPKTVIAGMISPPFRPLQKDEDTEYIHQINAAKPDFIWVGLGAPKQDYWMADHLGKVNGLMFGIGAAFDLLAGNFKRAPLSLQERNLEWTYRFVQEPSRLFKKYFYSNLKFIQEAVIKGK